MSISSARAGVIIATVLDDMETPSPRVAWQREELAKAVLGPLIEVIGWEQMFATLGDVFEKWPNGRGPKADSLHDRVCGTFDASLESLTEAGKVLDSVATARFEKLVAEFPRFDLDTMPAPVPRHWSDESWHNDVSPSFRVKELEDGSYLKVWIDFEDESERELSGKRFHASWYNDDERFESFIETDDWTELLTAVERAEKEPPR